MQTRYTPGAEAPAKKKIASSDDNDDSKQPSPTLAEAMVAEAKRRAAAMLLAKKNAQPKVFNPIEAAKARAAEINKTFIQRKQLALSNIGSVLANQGIAQKQNQPPGMVLAATAASTQASTPAIPQTLQTAVLTTTQNQVSQPTPGSPSSCCCLEYSSTSWNIAPYDWDNSRCSRVVILRKTSLSRRSIAIVIAVTSTSAKYTLASPCVLQWRACRPS